MDRPDVLVVGAGLTGCATAWHLGRQGASVLIVDRGDVGAGASGQNAGSLHFQIERRFLEHGEALADQASRVIALNRLAIAEWRGLEAALGAPIEVVLAGGLMVAETAEELALLERKCAREAQYGIDTELVDGDKARAIAPCLSEKVIAASWLADEGHANPRLVTPAFAKAARAAGAEIATHATVAAIDDDGGGFSVTLREAGGPRKVFARQMLVAAGAWTAEVGALANLHLPILPAGLTMSATERVDLFMPHLIQHVGRRLSMKQTESGNVLIGGGWASRLHRDDTGAFDLSRTPSLRPENLRANLRAAVDTVPALADLALLRCWTGAVALAPDQLPLVGEVPSRPGFYVCAGGSGFTLGPVFARALAGALGGAAPDARLALFSPARFAHLNSFMG
jgi:glycine/D-amino acid oxidase-like deaminating enzyme